MLLINILSLLLHFLFFTPIRKEETKEKITVKAFSSKEIVN